MSNLSIGIISAIVIMLGTVGAVVPFLPGIPLSLAGLFFYAIFSKFETVGAAGLIVFSILTILTVVVDLIAPVLGAKGYQASRWGVLGAAMGAIFGIFIFGPLGILLGPFIGAYLGEIANSMAHEHAVKAAFGALIGLVIGSAFKLIVGFSMFIYLAVVIWRQLG